MFIVNSVAAIKLLQQVSVTPPNDDDDDDDDEAGGWWLVTRAGPRPGTQDQGIF